MEEVIKKALGPYTQRLDRLERDQDALIRRELSIKLQREHPDLDEEDISRGLALAARDRTKTLGQHLESLVESKKSYMTGLEKKFAEKYGVDLEEWNKRNALKEQGTIEKALPEALMSTGQAIAVTTMTTVIGFLALSFASLVNTQRLGWTLSLGILATFFSCMLIVPAILTIQYRNKPRRWSS